MAIPLSETLPCAFLLLLAALFALTATAESYCSDAMATSLLSSGFTRFLYTLHAHNLTTTAAAAASRLTYLAPPDTTLMNHNLDYESLRSHISTDGALTYQSLLALSPNTTLSTLRRRTSLVVGTDGERVSFNEVLVSVPNLYVDGSCVVHGVDGPLVPISSSSPPIDDSPIMATRKFTVVPKRQTLQMSTYSRFIRRANALNVTKKDVKSGFP